jgi:AcrR family transcriptional regulator
LVLVAEYAAHVAESPVAAVDARERKGDRTRRLLLEIAVRRFATDGYRRTSVSDIARDAGITPATTYAYYAGKEALFAAAVDTDAAALIDGARAAMHGETVRERWLPWIGTLITLLGEHPLARRVLSGREPDIIHRLLDLPSLATVRTELAAHLRVGQQTGEIRGDIDADQLAAGIETFVLSLLMGVSQAGAPAVEANRAAGVIALLDAALRAPEPRSR